MSTHELYLELESVVKTEKTQIGNEITHDFHSERPFYNKPERRILLCNCCVETQHNIRSLKIANENLKRNYVTLKKDYSNVEKKCESFEMEISALNEHLKEAKHKYEVLEQQCEEYQMIIKRNGNKKKTLKENNVLMDLARSNLNSQILSVNKENSQLRAKLEELQRSLDYQTIELKKTRILYSKMNQEYVVLKLKYEGGDACSESSKFKPRKANSCIMSSRVSNTEKISYSRSVDDNMVVDGNCMLKCKNCGTKYSKKTSLRSHLRHCLRKSNQSDLNLSISSEVLESMRPSSREELSRRKSTPEKRSSESGICCSICGRAFLRPCNLGKHMTVHLKMF